MKKLVLIGTLLMLAPVVSFAQTTTSVQATATPVEVTPGFVPGDFFYFLDQWTEALNLAFTFNNGNKARKHLEYAKERIAEMDEVLKGSEATLVDIVDAKDNFGTQVSLAASLVKEEKDKGVDVKDLARELDDELDSTRDALKNILKEHKDKSSRAEEEIRAKLASLSPNDPQVQGLAQALESIIKEKASADKEDEDIDAEIKDEQDLFEEMMGEELSTEKQLEEVMKLRDLVEQGLPEGALREGDMFMKNAEEAIRRGDFEKAKGLSEDAQRAIERVREMQDDEEMRQPGVLDREMEDGVNDSDVRNLEDEIKRGEKIMEGFDGEQSNDSDNSNR